jgi:kynureninase
MNALNLSTAMDLATAQALDAADSLRGLRDLFEIPQGVIYLDGNSLGVLPRTAATRVAHVVQQEWGVGLIRSWNAAGWIDMPQRVGDKIAPLIGARAGEVVCADSTSVNLFKVLNAAILIASRAIKQGSRGQKGIENCSKNIVLSERSNFPTDLYIAQSLCTQHGLQLQLVDATKLPEALNDNVAVLLLTHINYRTGAMHDMAALTAKAHAVGALAVWDLAHSAGAVPVDLHAARADMAVGCGYKYLNGGPGAPAFVWVHPRHVDAFEQPLSGWMGHAAPFVFTPDYKPAKGIARYLCGTPPVLSLAALECGVDTLLTAQSPELNTDCGSMHALRTKSLALTDLFITLVAQRCAGHELELVTPRQHAQRGSQVSYAKRDNGYAIMQALIARGVIGDFRAGTPGASRVEDADILRFGFTPLYVGFADVWQAVEHLHQVLSTGEWQRAEFNQQQTVT